MDVNGRVIDRLHLVEFNNDGSDIQIKAIEESALLFGRAKPFNEPVVAQGPFVMNTREEILQAHDDYRKGMFGVWKD